MAYVGDTGGVRVSGDYLIAPTPPPDIDLEAWQAEPRHDRRVAAGVAVPDALRPGHAGARAPRAVPDDASPRRRRRRAK